MDASENALAPFLISALDSKKELSKKNKNTPDLPIPRASKKGKKYIDLLLVWLKTTIRAANPRRPSKASSCRLLSEMFLFIAKVNPEF